MIPHVSGDKTDQIQTDMSALHQDIGGELQPVHIVEPHCSGEQDKLNEKVNQGDKLYRIKIS